MMNRVSVESMLAKLVDMYNFDTRVYRWFINIYDSCKQNGTLDIERVLVMIDEIRKDKAPENPLIHLSEDSLNLEYALLEKAMSERMIRKNLPKCHEKYARKAYIQARLAKKDISASLCEAQAAAVYKHQRKKHLLLAGGMCTGMCWLALAAMCDNGAAHQTFKKQIEPIQNACLKVKKIFQR